MDSIAEETSHHTLLRGGHLRFLRVRTGAKLLAIVIILLFSPVLPLASSYGLSHLNQADPHTVPNLAVPLAINVLSLTASPSFAFVGQEVTFFANASSDDPGATLTFTIFYDYYAADFSVNANSAVSVNTTSNPGTVITNYTYHNVGNFSTETDFYLYAKLWVSDGTGDNQSALTQVFVNVHRPPHFRSSPSDPLTTSSNVNTTMSIYIDDPNGDTVTVFWDFGDGANATNVTVAPPYPGGVFLNQYHTWSPKIPGNPAYIVYRLNVSLSDGFTPLVWSRTEVKVSLPLNNPPTMDIHAFPTTVNPLQNVTFTANATDPEGDPLTWTYNYSDGAIHVFHTDWSAPGKLIWQNDTHAFASTGNYTAKVSVSDALVPYQTSYHNVSRTSANIEVKLNIPPVLTVIILNPKDPEINATRGYVDAKCSIDVYDADGDILTLTWRLNGVVVGTNASAGENYFVKYIHVTRFNETGTYNISVTVTDGVLGHERMGYKVVNVTSNNHPPEFVRLSHDPYKEGNFATPNETLRFYLVATDPERDTLELIWDFGDGSPRLYMNLTQYIGVNATATVNHTYRAIGDYSLQIILTDNQLGLYNHTVTKVQKIPVSTATVKVAIVWDWWDYSSLGLVLMIPVGIALWAVRLRVQRKKIEDQGMTYDEYKLRRGFKSEEFGKQ